MTRLRINGEPMSVDADPRMPLLWVIRDVLGMTGTKFGCGVGACGACTVHLDGDAVRSCVTALADADGKDVTTVVVEVAVDDRGQVGVPRVDLAVDCGLVINPDRVRGQMEGAVIMGLSNALYSNISVKQGQIQQSNFTDYLVARTDITPQTHITIVDSHAPPGGVGEPVFRRSRRRSATPSSPPRASEFRALPIDPDLLHA